MKLRLTWPFDVDTNNEQDDQFYSISEEREKPEGGGERKEKATVRKGEFLPLPFCVVVDRFHGAIRMRKKALIDTRQAIDNAAGEPRKKRVFCIIPLISSVTLMIFEVSSGQILNYSREREGDRTLKLLSNDFVCTLREQTCVGKREGGNLCVSLEIRSSGRRRRRRRRKALVELIVFFCLLLIECNSPCSFTSVDSRVFIMIVIQFEDCFSMHRAEVLDMIKDQM